MKKNIPYYLLGLIALLIVLSVIRNMYRDYVLKGEKVKTLAFITSIKSGSGVRQSPGIYYTYKVNGSIYSGYDSGNFNTLNEGDSLLIEYAKDAPSISQVVLPERR